MATVIFILMPYDAICFYKKFVNLVDMSEYGRETEKIFNYTGSA